MKRIVLPVMLLCSTIALAQVNQKKKSDTLVQEKQVEEVIMTASRTYINRSEAPIAITKLDRKIIEQTKARTMWELVNKTPGVFMRQLSDAEGSSMSIRQPMSTTNYFLYLEDGIPIRPQGFHNHNGLSLYSNVLGVENIEIAKGPVSSIYGPEAVGGAVNVITRKAGEQPQYMIGYQGDEYWDYFRKHNECCELSYNSYHDYI
jgi:outer membrane cobalamin receptor